MKTLILGATGFAGQNVAKLFKEKGMDVILSSRTQGLDLLQPAAIKEFLHTHQPDYIINCAAHVGSLNYVTQHAADVMLDNSRMLLNLYEAIATLPKKPVVISPIANCAYPATSTTFVEEEWWNGPLHRSVMAYGSTRRLMWSIGESFLWQHNIQSVYLLVPNMYGPFDSTDPNKAHALNALVSKFVKAEKENRAEIGIWGTGIAIREWLYSGDFARVMYEVVTNKNLVGLSEPVNIAQNFGLSVRELVGIINGYFGNKFTIKWDESMPDGAPRKVMDDRRFTKIFPNFKFQDFEEGIFNVINYYKSVYPY